MIGILNVFSVRGGTFLPGLGYRVSGGGGISSGGSSKSNYISPEEIQKNKESYMDISSKDVVSLFGFLSPLALGAISIKKLIKI